MLHVFLSSIFKGFCTLLVDILCVVSDLYYNVQCILVVLGL